MNAIPEGEEVINIWADNDNVVVFQVLDDLNQPFSCSMWGDFGVVGLPIIVDDGPGYNIFNWFEFSINAYPKNIFIDHEMRVHYLNEQEMNTTAINSIIEQMVDNMPELAINEQYIPNELSISSVYPNPFNPTTHIEYILSNATHTTVSIIDLSGKVIDQLYSGFQTKGLHQVNWDASKFSSGTYFVHLISGDIQTTQKLVYLR